MSRVGTKPIWTNVGAEEGSPWQEMRRHRWQEARPRLRQSPDPAVPAKGSPEVLHDVWRWQQAECVEVQGTGESQGNEWEVNSKAESGAE